MKSIIKLGGYRGGAFTQLSHTCKTFCFYNSMSDFLVKLINNRSILYNEIGWELLPFSISQLFTKTNFYRIPNNGLFQAEFLKRFALPIRLAISLIIRYNRLSVQNSYQFVQVRKQSRRNLLLFHYNLGPIRNVNIKKGDERVYIGSITRKKNLEGIKVDKYIGKIVDPNYAALIIKNDDNYFGEKSRKELLNYLTNNRPVVCSNSVFEGWPNIIFDGMNSGCLVEFNAKVNLTDLYYRIPNVYIKNAIDSNSLLNELYSSNITKSKLERWYRETSQ